MKMAHVAVVGGGLVGATAALGIADLGFDVTLIEPNAPTDQKGSLGIDVRNVALSQTSQTLLKRFDVWPQSRLAPYYHMCVWEQWGSSVLNFAYGFDHPNETQSHHHAILLGDHQTGWVHQC